MDKIQLIEQAIENGTKRISKLSEQAIQIPFLGSLQIRHTLNNLGSLCNKYMEVGCHKGGSFCSTVYGNYNIRWGTAIDNFLSDKTNGETAQFQFLNNALYFRPHSMELRLMVGDCFDIDTKALQDNVDMYLFDGSHDYESQKKALTYYYPVLADEFIFCVDDSDWQEVWEGTQDGIKEGGYKVLFEQRLHSNISREDGGHDNESYWNGFYVSLLKK